MERQRARQECGVTVAESERDGWLINSRLYRHLCGTVQKFRKSSDASTVREQEGDWGSDGMGYSQPSGTLCKT